MKWRMAPLPLLAALLVALSAAPALAVPLVAVDTDPLAPGVQASRTVEIGESFDIDIVISGVEASRPLHTFELDLLFSDAVLSALSVVAGGFLAEPSSVLAADVTPPDVTLLAATLGSGVASGDGVLGSIRFEAAAPGTSGLLFAEVKLATSFLYFDPDLDVPLGIERTLQGGSITVREPSSEPIPEPRAALLFGLGCACVAGSLRGPRRL
jgi:hypothetical protein